MASPQTLVLCLLVLAVTEACGQEAVIPGCHLHREYLWQQTARRSGGSGWEHRADRVDSGASSTLEGPTLRHRQQELGRGKPWQRHRLLLACLPLAFNVTVRSDRQGTCQGSHMAQACVGHCESSAFPSRYSVLVASGYRHNITSVSQCCTISGLKKVRRARARSMDVGVGGRLGRWRYKTALRKGTAARTPLSCRSEYSCSVWGAGGRSSRSSLPGPASVTCVASLATSPSSPLLPPLGHRT